MVYVGKKSYVFFKRESSWNNQEAMGQSGVNHIPFNPMVSFRPPKPKYTDQIVYLFHQLEPSIVYTQRMETGQGQLEMLYRDPWVLLNGVFTRKTKTNPWTGTTDQLIGNFTTQSHENSLAIQYYIESQTAHNIERTLKGVDVTQYQWIVQQGQLLRERVSFRAASFADASQAPDIDANFDGGEFNRTGVDGGFANWSQSGSNSGFFHASDISLKWGGSALAGIHIVDFTLTIDVPKEHHFTYEQKYATVHSKMRRAWRCEVNGLLKTKAHVAELEKVFSSKTTSNTLQVLIATNHYLQFTNSFFIDGDIIGIPEAGQPARCRFVIEGGQSSALSYLGEWSIAQDPANMISYTAA